VPAERDQFLKLCFDPAPRCLAQPVEGVVGYHCEIKVTSAGPDWVELATHSISHSADSLHFWHTDGTAKCRMAASQLECEGSSTSTNPIGLPRGAGVWKVTMKKEVQK
jgi:hypothetical protein